MISFEEIYNSYFSDVYRFILKLSNDQHIAEEITQETFYKALKNIDNFKGNSQMKVWLCQIAKNTYFTKYNQEK
ncbi:MAG: RNA polymerase sigma factor, partial [Paraclostridium sp.]